MLITDLICGAIIILPFAVFIFLMTDSSWGRHSSFSDRIFFAALISIGVFLTTGFFGQFVISYLQAGNLQNEVNALQPQIIDIYNAHVNVPYPQLNKTQAHSITLRGKALVWDIDENSFSFDINSNLDNDIQIKSGDINKPYTLFIIAQVKRAIGQYSGTYETAYYRDVYTYISYMPEKSIVGVYYFNYTDPSSKSIGADAYFYGAGANWINGLPRT